MTWSIPENCKAINVFIGGLILFLVLAGCQPQTNIHATTNRPENVFSDATIPPTITSFPAPFSTYITVTPTSMPTLAPTAPSSPSKAVMSTDSPLIYYAQSGDTLDVIASHFNISATQITSPDPIPDQGLVPYNQPLYLPAYLSKHLTSDFILPDSEVVFGPSGVDFDIDFYLRRSRGDLATYREYLASTGWNSAAEIIQRIALENSINPRLLLALLEYHCHGVSGEISEDVDQDALLGNTHFLRLGLYRQLSWASDQLSIGYYGWRSGQLNEFTLADGSLMQPAPNLNAGSVALQYYFAYKNDRKSWKEAIDPQTGFAALYERMFGDPWERALQVEPLLPADLIQTPMQLPFEENRGWSYTSGPHSAWEKNGALAALDFAPATYNSGCLPTDAWVAAVADGQVVRAELNGVMQDLDDPVTGEGDGIEQTGWAVFYYHIAKNGMVAADTYLKAGERIGQPSCEGGRSTGTHVHIARKFNGEWVIADGYLPFNLSGWIAHNGEKPYQGTLTKDGMTVVAHWFGSFETRIGLPTKTPIVP